MKAAHEIATPSPLVKALDVSKIRADFPILEQKVHGKPLVYLDNGATSQKPQSVIDVLHRYYSTENSNIHRGVHYLSERATAAYETARQKIKSFVNARSEREIIFVRGTTEAINLVAQSYGRTFLKKGDERIRMLEQVDRLPDLQQDYTQRQTRVVFQKAKALRGGLDPSKVSPEKLKELSTQMLKKYDEVQAEGRVWPQPTKP